MKSASPFVYVKDVEGSIKYYQNMMGGETKILNKNAKKILHAELHLGNSLIHFADTFGKFPLVRM